MMNQASVEQASVVMKPTLDLNHITMKSSSFTALFPWKMSPKSPQEPALFPLKPLKDRVSGCPPKDPSGERRPWQWPDFEKLGRFHRKQFFGGDFNGDFNGF
jgi:hypothetical protein